jgi:ABC-type multidrug transport system permease subunit
LGIFVGILLKDANVAIQVVPLIITPLIMFGGLPVNLNTMADYASWMQYFDPVQYGYKALLLNQLNTDSLLHLGQYQVVKDLVGVSDTQEYNLTLLILLIYTLFVFTFLALYIRRKL